MSESAGYAELHLHLEGSVDADALKLIQPNLREEEIAERTRFSDFAGFIQAYIWVSRQLTQPEHYGIAVQALLDRLASERIFYAEITLSAGVVLWKQQDLDAIFQAMRQAAKGHAVQVRWIFDAIRHFGAEHIAHVAEQAVRYRDQGVVGFGVGGDESRADSRWLDAGFRIAREGGLALVPHAGETTGPQIIWDVLERGAQRVGHGIGAVEDPVLLRHLRDRQIPLEICLTSNVMTGAVTSLQNHPLRRLYDAGVPITLHTDDPALFHTTLGQEFQLARTLLGCGEAEWEGIRRNAWRFRCEHLLPVL